MHVPTWDTHAGCRRIGARCFVRAHTALQFCAVAALSHWRWRVWQSTGVRVSIAHITVHGVCCSRRTRAVGMSQVAAPASRRSPAKADVGTAAVSDDEEDSGQPPSKAIAAASKRRIDTTDRDFHRGHLEAALRIIASPVTLFLAVDSVAGVMMGSDRIKQRNNKPLTPSEIAGLVTATTLTGIILGVAESTLVRRSITRVTSNTALHWRRPCSGASKR